MKIRFYISVALVLTGLSSCKKFLDIIPDNIATIENAFALRTEAEKYLFTCYSYVPANGSMAGNPAFSAGDEISLVYPLTITAPAYEIARGNQNKINPVFNLWDGSGSQTYKDLFNGIRDCNIFLDNIGRVPDITDEERNRWIAEVKFLKAYYHFYLFRMYGPIPLVRKNLSVDAPKEEAMVYRDPVDSCVNYMVQLLDEAKEALPLIVSDPVNELGRITQGAAYMLKAKILVTAASPLFNGNADYASFKDNRGVALFSATPDPAKWTKAVTACKEAIDVCTNAGNKLYYFEPDVTQTGLSPETRTQMNLRNAINLKWNPEIIWGNTNSMTSALQTNSIPRGLDPALIANSSPAGLIAPTLNVVELFYSKNGVPITEDKTWNYANRYTLRTGTNAERYYIGLNYVTAQLNFDREPRYYASMGFDGGVWFGQGKYDDKSPFVLQAKAGQAAAGVTVFAYSTTGYWTKKYVHYQDVIGSGTSLSIQNYPWPEMRLADLFLLYAEALNEAQGPVPEVLDYLNQVRERAGIPAVAEAWTQYSTNPSAYTTKEGLRTIIHRERTVELAFEGSRYWDLKRWKEAANVLNTPVRGWTREQAAAAGYYQPRVLFNQTFGFKDYFWPIKDGAITINRNLVQNPGW
ncbi:RagB/SusD family nutrient uptake outer membrane protein [Niabella drilacis]|uniref:Starch-binding associating with outer membrane n=1 Tax=Niabella drilacis (strain DSM 25811 / CCM 8410 / CCUG 62505 / LMG 26954 / E90) TaxID=1285928 RepID=A0A1G6YKJ6_NIADE|nr:RagB/SusD family nutrient uptake outer membrane protein [Niabella drilacis]SDD90801.1 Starch-binding associating with outer membrane [Niabella drilacis]